MRTTVTLDDDVAARLKELVRRTGASFKATLNDLIRRGLAAQTARPRLRRVRVEPAPTGLRPGVDPGRLNQLVDDLEADEFARKAGAR